MLTSIPHFAIPVLFIQRNYLDFKYLYTDCHLFFFFLHNKALQNSCQYSIFNSTFLIVSWTHYIYPLFLLLHWNSSSKGQKNLQIVKSNNQSSGFIILNYQSIWHRWSLISFSLGFQDDMFFSMNAPSQLVLLNVLYPSVSEFGTPQKQFLVLFFHCLQFLRF